MGSTVFDSALFRDMFGTAEMRAIFGDEALVACYIEAEVALAHAQATVSDEATPAAIATRPRATITLSNGAAPAGGASQPTATAGFVPEFHTVNSGDTLWDISGYYFENPWFWPRVWARNPQITNPHWIYPGDQVRLLLASEVVSGGPAATTTISPTRGGGVRIERSAPRFPRGTIFLRESAWATTDDISYSGSIVGAPEDGMLLSEGDQTYVEFERRAPNVGESYTVYAEAQATQAADRDSGRVVRVLGTVVVDSWDAHRHIATCRITESLEPIERGERVAMIQRQFLPVPPVANDRDLTAHIIATPTVRTFSGSNFVVIVDRGSEDGVRLGNRFFILQRGDPWRTSVADQGRGVRVQEIDRDGDGHVDHAPDASNSRPNDELPVEVFGEMTTIAVHPRTSLCLVTLSAHELELGAPVVMRRGY